MEQIYMNEAVKQAKKSFKYDEVPVGCVIVKDNKIISRAHNKKEKFNNPLNHAEVLAIKKACGKLKTWRLDGCTLYTTSEPCVMCIGAISLARIKKVTYAVENKKFGFSHFIEGNRIMNFNIIVKKMDGDFTVEKLLKDFFKNKRK
ncbi:MAG: nucleoside deaminase [Bacilli bacterium]|nr:nucleoside deaminase [Bacilli bacterium]